jgi:hypothetical protein
MKKFICFTRRIRARVFQNTIWDGHCWDENPYREGVICIDCGTQDGPDYWKRIGKEIV